MTISEFVHYVAASGDKESFFVPTHLVKDESLADVAPVADGSKVLDEHQEQQHKGYAGKCINGIDQEHHDHAAKYAQYAGMPRKTTKRGSKDKRKTKITHSHKNNGRIYEEGKSPFELTQSLFALLQCAFPLTVICLFMLYLFCGCLIGPHLFSYF